MMEVPEHGYAFNDNSMEVDPLALVDTAIKTEIKEDPDQLPENTVQHELLQHGEQSEDYHGIKVEEMDESHFHIASNSDLPSIHDVGSAQLDASDNSVVSSSVVRGLQNDYQDVKNKYTHSILTLRRQSDVLTQTHAEMQMEIVALKADKANLWNDLAAATAKECTYLRQIEELKKKHDQKMKTLKNNYERLLLEQNGHVEETIWRTATVLGHKVEQLAASNKNYLGIIEALKDKLKLQEQYKLAVEIKKTSLNHKVNTLLENINDLHIKLLKERKSAGNYLLLYKQMAAENTALRNQIQEKNSVLIVLRDQIHSSKVELDKQKQSFKNQTVAGKNAEVKALTLQNDLRMKITLLDQLRAQKHRIIKKNKALINECITLTEKLQGTNVELKQLKTEFDQLKTEMEQQKNKTCEYCGL